MHNSENKSYQGAAPVPQRRCVPVVLLFLLFNTFVFAAPENFEQAKRLLSTKIYHDRPITFYCECPIVWKGSKGAGEVDLAGCGYGVRKNETRAKRVEWEHVMPAHSFGEQRQCWQNGERKNCVATDPVFRQMEADMHNLVPSIGEVNGDRSNYRFGMLPSTPYQHGKCDFKVDFKQRVAQPRPEIRGDIARIYFYMHDRYSLRMSDQQRKLFEAWARQDPVDEWERERNRRITQHMGHGNAYIQNSGHQ